MTSPAIMKNGTASIVKVDTLDTILGPSGIAETLEVKRLIPRAGRPIAVMSGIPRRMIARNNKNIIVNVIPAVPPLSYGL